MKLFANREGVEKIGVHLVYKQDIVDPNQTIAQCINNSSTLYEDLADSEDQPESEIFDFFASKWSSFFLLLYKTSSFLFLGRILSFLFSNVNFKVP